MEITSIGASPGTDDDKNWFAFSGTLENDNIFSPWTAFQHNHFR